MYSKQLRRHGHCHGRRHHRIMRHGERHENYGHCFRHSAHRMCNDPVRERHHRGMRGLDFKRRCLSESELPDASSENVGTEAQEAIIRNIVRDFFRRRHQWRRGSRRCQKCGISLIAENVKAGENSNDPNLQNPKIGEKNDGPAIIEENEKTDETNDIPMESAENIKEQNKAQESSSESRHLRHHCRRRFARFCLSCLEKGPDTTENQGEKRKAGEGDAIHGSGKHIRGHHKGKRECGFRKVCAHGLQDSDTTEIEEITDGEEDICVKQGYIRRRYRGHRRGKREHGSRKMDPSCSEVCAPTVNNATSEEEGEARRKFKGRHYHQGKWSHGLRREHHRGWRRHGCRVIMIDAAVNTENFENTVQEENPNMVIGSQEDTNANQVLEQLQVEEVGEEHANADSAEVLEVADSLKKSSLE